MIEKFQSSNLVGVDADPELLPGMKEPEMLRLPDLVRARISFRTFLFPDSSLRYRWPQAGVVRGLDVPGDLRHGGSFRLKRVVDLVSAVGLVVSKVACRLRVHGFDSRERQFYFYENLLFLFFHFLLFLVRKCQIAVLVISCQRPSIIETF